MQRRIWFALSHLLCFLAAIAVPVSAVGAEGITWRVAERRVDADVRDWELPRLLETIARVTKWEVYVQPGVESSVTAGFKQNSPDEALKKLLAGINYSLAVPTNGVPRLSVYRTSAREATQRINIRDLTLDRTGEPKLIPNELIVTLKPGGKSKIEEIARLLGAKVVGRHDGLNAYRLQFDDEAATNSARQNLERNSEIIDVDANYSIERPPVLQAQLAGDAPLPRLRLTAPPSDGRIVVGLIDTGIQPLPGNLNEFLLPKISVAGSDYGALPDEPLHATAMAETILRSLAGNGDAASGVRILPVDIYGPNQQTTTFDVAGGVFKAVESGANLINLSLGGTGDSSVLHDLIQQATKQGVVFLAAAGNEPVTTPTLPAAYPEVTAVSSMNPDGSIADYANRGSFVDVLAPDVAPVHGGGGTYVISGTSVATAFATGATAARAERGGVSLTTAVNQLKQSSPPPAQIPK